MLRDPIICCHVWMAAQVVAAWAWRTVVALQVLILCAASIAAMVTLWQVRQQQQQPSRFAWLVTLGLVIAFGGSTLAMLV